jgi:hypothetical protein
MPPTRVKEWDEGRSDWVRTDQYPIKIVDSKIYSPRTIHPTTWFTSGRPAFACSLLAEDTVMIIAIAIKVVFQSIINSSAIHFSRDHASITTYLGHRQSQKRTTKTGLSNHPTCSMISPN